MSHTSRKHKFPFIVRRSPIQGYGAFARQRIRPGQLVAEYFGKFLNGEEQDEKYDDDSMPRHHTFLFYVTEQLTIDGDVPGNKARFINHSCAPNCYSYTDVKRKRVFIYALQNIQPGCEITYDYAYIRAGRYRKYWDKLYACHCGKPKCRGTILYKPKKKRKSHKSGTFSPHRVNKAA